MMRFILYVLLLFLGLSLKAQSINRIEGDTVKIQKRTNSKTYLKVAGDINITGDPTSGHLSHSVLTTEKDTLYLSQKHGFGLKLTGNSIAPINGAWEIYDDGSAELDGIITNSIFCTHNFQVPADTNFISSLWLGATGVFNPSFIAVPNGILHTYNPFTHIWDKYLKNSDLSSSLSNYATTSKVQSDSNTLATAINGKQAALGFTPYNATNPSGFITNSSLTPYVLSTKQQADSNTLATAINGKQAALGFTPYNATNPSGFITSSSLTPYVLSTKQQTDSNTLAAAINGKQTALGFTPYNATNPSGFITSSSLTPYVLSTKQQADSNTLATAINGKQAALGFTPYNVTNPSGFITSSSLTPYATTAKVQGDSTTLSAATNSKLNITDTVNIRPKLVAGSNITIAGTYPNLTIGGSNPLTNFTDGAVLFSKSQAITEDSLNLYYNNVTARLGIGAITSGNTLINPPMTSNTLPVPFVASINAAPSGGSAFNLCSNPTVNVLFNGSSPWWWQINMGTPIPTNSYSITPVYGYQYTPSTFKWLGSNDGSNFDTLDSRTSFSSFNNGLPYTFNYNRVSSATYQYYRLYITATNVYQPYLTAIGLYNSTTTHLIPLAKLGITTVSPAEKGQIIQGVVLQSANLSEWQSSSGNILAKVDASGNIKTGGTLTVVGALLDSSTITSTSNIIGKTFNTTIAPTAITGAGGSGTAYFSEPFQGTATNGGYKKIMIYLNAFVSSGGTTITYSSSGGIAFTNTPFVTGTSSCVSAVGSPSATAITITTASPLTGYIFLEGN